MPHVVVVLDAEETGFSDHSEATVTAAQELSSKLDSEVAVIVFLPEHSDPSAVQVDWDVSDVLVVENSDGRIDGLAAEKVLTELLADQDPIIVMMAHTGLGVETAAGLAAVQGYGFGGDLLSVDFTDRLTAIRTRFGGKVLEELGFDIERTNILTIRDGVYSPTPRINSEAPIESRVYSVSEQPLTDRIKIEAPDTPGVDITKADFVLAVGRGIGDEENVSRFAAIADKLGATYAASRPLVDIGWMAAERQVGQSGKTVNPKVYLALGISGSIQHVAGMRSSSTIIAVNTDASAPIFEIADFGAVMDVLDLADAFELSLESAE